MTLELLLEIGCEEIPARYLDSILEQLKERLSESLSESKLALGQIQTFATPRRLIVVVCQLSSCQPNGVENITGPPFAVAFENDKTPTRAAEGFARKYHVRIEDLRCIETDKGQYLGFEKRVPGKEASQVLLELLPSILAELEFPKRMKWEESQFFFVRPIRWILCLLNGEVLPIHLAGIRASNETYGHRILDKNLRIQVKNFEDYGSQLVKLHVQIDQNGRLDKIKSHLQNLATSQCGVVIDDPQLLKTVVYHNEYPSVLCGNFDSSYLRLPREVLITVMREHQKYFSLQDDQGKLLPKFLAVVDSDEAHHSSITLGHERVLRARLADASFFWDTDIKISLEIRSEKLRKIIFHEKLGTVYDKTRRIGTLAEFIARSLRRHDLVKNLDLAAKLCKADLTTEMVKEFTNLQGIMGGLYAQSQGIDETVATAIYDHYKPAAAEDSSPRSLEGAILSISDKLDSVMAAFSINQVPTGSKDPLALRRQTLAVIKVLLDHRISLSLSRLATKAYSNLKRLPHRSFEESYPEFRDFVKDRLKFVFKEQGYRYDEINAIVEADSDNPLECLERLRAIAAMRNSQDFYSLSTGFKRIKNILTKAGLDSNNTFSVNPELFEAEEERNLFRKIESVKPAIRRLRKTHQYQTAFELLASLRPQVDLFFDQVLVMAKDKALQKNRLALLGDLLMVFTDLADISEIAVS